MGAANKISQVYDFSTIGVAKSLSEITQLGDQLERNVKLKQELSKIKDNTSDPATIRKVTTEIDKQATAHKNNVVKMNTAVASGLKLASVNKELTLQIVNVVDKVENATHAVNDRNKAEVEAILNAKKWSDAEKKSITISNQKKAVITNEITSIRTLNAENKKLRMERDGLDLSTKAGALRARELNAAIAENTAIIHKNQDEVIKQKMNIGNYGSALSKLWSGLRNIAYILPGLGIAGIFNIAGEAIASAWSKLNLFNNSLREFKDTLLEGQKNSTQEIVELERIYKITQDVTRSITDRKEAVDKLQELYPAYFKNISDENILNGNARSIYDGLKKSIIEVAKAKAVESKITEIINSGIEDELKLTEDLKKAKAAAFLDKGKITAGETEYGPDGTPTSTGVDDAERKRLVGRAQSRLDYFKMEQNNKLQIYQDYLNKTDAIELKHVQETGSKSSATAASTKAQEDRERIIFDAKVALLDAQAAEELKLKNAHEEDLKKLSGASNEDKKLVEEAYQKELKAIRDKYAKAYYDSLFEQDLDEMKLKAEQAKKKEDEEKKNRQHTLDLVNDTNKEVQKKADEAHNLSEQKQKEHEDKIKKLKKEALDGALQLAQQFAQSQAQIAQQAVDKRFEEQTSFINTEKEKRLAQAQSAAEKQAIEEEFAQKEKAAERQRNIERQEVAKKQLAIEFALASIKAISTSSNIYEGLIKEGIVLGEYLIALNNLNSQKFEQGGQVPTSTGGDITGPSHTQGGVPFSLEAQGGEMAIINKNSTMDKGTYNLTGTPRQIASAINTIGGGVQFAPGALTRKFEYGGLLGSNLSAPVFRGYYQSASNGSSSEFGIETLRAITAVSSKVEALQVTLNPHAVTKAQNNFTKQTQVGTI